MRPWALALVAAMLAVGAFGGAAHAQDSGVHAPTAEDKKAAAEKFAEGERSFKAGDFTRAAEAFEAAHHLVPHPAASWNAARSRHRAGEKARAANLYARYLLESAPDAPDRTQASRALAELSSQLGRIELTGDARDVTVDGEPAPASVVWVDPGKHVVRGTAGGEPVTKEAMVSAGTVVTIALTAGLPPAPTASASTAQRPAPASERKEEPTPADPPPPKPKSGWHPAVALVSGGASLVVGGLGVWAGIRTLEQKETYDAIVAEPGFDRKAAQEALDEGKRRQFVTNSFFFFAVTGALFSLVSAVALTNWSGREEPKAASIGVDLGPGGAGLNGRF